MKDSFPSKKKVTRSCSKRKKEKSQGRKGGRNVAGGVDEDEQAFTAARRRPSVNKIRSGCPAQLLCGWGCGCRRRDDGRSRRKMVTIGAMILSGGVALSAINDLAIFHGCTTKAIDKATEHPEVVQAIGLPIARGPWYDASVVLGHRRRSVSCTFPVTGPWGSGVFHIEAIRNGEDGVLSFLRHHDWEILAMDARLELQAVPSDDDSHQQQPLAMNLNLMTTAAHDDNECKTSSTAGGGKIS